VQLKPPQRSQLPDAFWGTNKLALVAFVVEMGYCKRSASAEMIFKERSQVAEYE
jgi:hypothetical protein